MAVFRGRKQFLWIGATEVEKLCLDRPTPGLDYGLGADPFNPDFTWCPEAKEATAWFADVKAGDVLYTPSHMHHAARNLVHSVGISQNFFTVHDN